MKRVYSVLFVTCCMSVHIYGTPRKSAPLMLTKSRNAARRKPGIDDKTKMILARIAEIFASFFGILQDPHDKANVAANVTGMVGGAVHMIAEAIKSGDLSLDASEEEIEAYAVQVKKQLAL